MKHDLIDIALFNPKIILDIKYASRDNFIGFQIYPEAVCYLHKDAAEALNKVQKELEKKDFGIKVFDGYRPLPVQQLMWDAIQDDRYCSDPAKNKGRHTRGTAVDLTLVDSNGEELEMPTLFDDFSEKAHSDCMDVSDAALHHRQILKEAMEKYGFQQFPFEWWHFDLIGWSDDDKYPPLELAFKDIKQTVC
jgi:zinc D-Ala-D-Ala dipeptidase